MHQLAHALDSARSVSSKRSTGSALARSTGSPSLRTWRSAASRVRASRIELGGWVRPARARPRRLRPRNVGVDSCYQSSAARLCLVACAYGVLVEEELAAGDDFLRMYESARAVFFFRQASEARAKKAGTSVSGRGGQMPVPWTRAALPALCGCSSQKKTRTPEVGGVSGEREERWVEAELDRRRGTRRSAVFYHERALDNGSSESPSAPALAWSLWCRRQSDQ